MPFAGSVGRTLLLALGLIGGLVDINYFSYITGIASLLGFVAQAMDWFPRHKDLRKFVTALVLGIFVGSLSSVFHNSSVVFNFAISGFSMLLLSLGGIILLLLAIAIYTPDSRKRGELYGISGIIGFIFAMTLFLGSLSSVGGEAGAIRNEKSRLTISELVFLSEVAAEKSDFDRALMHLELIRERLDSNDSRLAELDLKIEDLKRQQI
ncbi:hypothetical protein L4D08_25255 [Photobacterium chitinilyticum]|uniref:hypothetical protein n=1 Tax=Photobacterium chitinilyticum TaxID=2485123 RepID=UPI003D153550